MTGALVLGLTVAVFSALPIQAEDRRGDRTEARLHFERAEIAYKLGRYDEAIRGYEAAYRAMPEPAFLFNIAQSHRHQYRVTRKMDHAQKALALYKTYLRELPQAPNRETVLELIEELKSLITTVEDQTRAEKRRARIMLRGDEAAGAQVSVDGKLAGTIPLSHEVEPGVHLIRVSKSGFLPWSSSVSVDEGGQVEVPVMLQPEPAPPPTTGPKATVPIYKRWWFWTIVGAVAAGGATVGIVAATTGGDDIPAMPEIDLR